MKIANIGELKNRLSEFLSYVAQGEEVEVRKRNIPVARLIPIQGRQRNRTQLGCGRNSVRVLVELTEPLISEQDWEMLK